MCGYLRRRQQKQQLRDLFLSRPDLSVASIRRRGRLWELAHFTRIFYTPVHTVFEECTVLFRASINGQWVHMYVGMYGREILSRAIIDILPAAKIRARGTYHPELLRIYANSVHTDFYYMSAAAYRASSR